MGEQGLTASTIISFAKNLEDRSSIYYEELAKKFVDEKEAFLSFVKENKINNVLITRTYQETVTDAFETGFSFSDLDLNKYKIEVSLMKNEKLSDALKKSIELEEICREFYLIVAEKSKVLLATISTEFYKMAEKRLKRKLKLESTLQNRAR